MCVQSSQIAKKSNLFFSAENEGRLHWANGGWVEVWRINRSFQGKEAQEPISHRGVNIFKYVEVSKNFSRVCVYLYVCVCV